MLMAAGGTGSRMGNRHWGLTGGELVAVHLVLALLCLAADIQQKSMVGLAAT